MRTLTSRRHILRYQYHQQLNRDVFFSSNYNFALSFLTDSPNRYPNCLRGARIGTEESRTAHDRHDSIVSQNLYSIPGLAQSSSCSGTHSMIAYSVSSAASPTTHRQSKQRKRLARYANQCHPTLISATHLPKARRGNAGLFFSLSPRHKLPTTQALARRLQGSTSFKDRNLSY